MSDLPQTENPPARQETCDVLVVGGGPAGATISALLAEKGWKVCLLEKARHPRFHIGESLLPMNLPILERLGVMEEVEQIGIRKYGAEFNLDCPQTPPHTFYFSKARDRSYPYAFEVRRSEFDHLLLRNSARMGVQVVEGATATDIALNAEAFHEVNSRSDDGSQRLWRCRYLIDASGRDTLLSRRLGLKKKHPTHGMAAVFGHFENVERRCGRDEGNISIYWFRHGWFWMIPLADGITSVGAVCWPEYLKEASGKPDDMLRKTIDLCPGVRQRMEKASLVGEARATGNYSYLSTRMSGKGFLLVGDAYAFIDPVFSSGVYLAMSAGQMASDVVDAQLRGDPDADERLRNYERTVKRGIRMFSWFIFRFTSPAMRQLFMSPHNRSGLKNPRNLFRMEESIVSLLAGDIFRGTPIRASLAVFKSIYFVTAVFNFRRSFAAWLKRRKNAREVLSGRSTSRT